MGSLDPNGVWIYDDNDHVVPISAYENLGQQSVSTALTDFREQVEDEFTVINTGWVDLVLNAAAAVPVAGYPCQVKRYGDVVKLRGRITRPTAWIAGESVLGSLPTITGIPLTPPANHECGPIMYGTSSSGGRLIVTPEGSLRGFNFAVAGTGTIYLSASTPWLMD